MHYIGENKGVIKAMVKSLVVANKLQESLWDRFQCRLDFLCNINNSLQKKKKKVGTVFVRIGKGIDA